LGLKNKREERRSFFDTLCLQLQYAASLTALVAEKDLINM
jgi:hypothetical protein